MDFGGVWGGRGFLGDCAGVWWIPGLLSSSGVFYGSYYPDYLIGALGARFCACHIYRHSIFVDPALCLNLLPSWNHLTDFSSLLAQKNMTYFAVFGAPARPNRGLPFVVRN